ncbi:MAG: hypothetical protein JWP63_5708 [Candidatus Solibacter sp.]|jgi:hypothetical protein|nr:hypothetical protein [Candidatus Solibacter sp.]
MPIAPTQTKAAERRAAMTFAGRRIKELPVEVMRSWTDADGYTVHIYDSLGSTWICVSATERRNGGTSFGADSPVEEVTNRRCIDALGKMGKDPADYRVASGALVRVAAVPFIESVKAEMLAQIKEMEPA